jgi:hypothetical protein
MPAEPDPTRKPSHWRMQWVFFDLMGDPFEFSSALSATWPRRELLVKKLSVHAHRSGQVSVTLELEAATLARAVERSLGLICQMIEWARVEPPQSVALIAAHEAPASSRNGGSGPLWMVFS